MRTLLPSLKIRITLFLLSTLLIIHFSYCEFPNPENSTSTEIKSLNNVEKEILHNLLEELIQFKNNFFSRNRKCNPINNQISRINF